MGPTNALSQWDEVDTSMNNQDVTLLPEVLFSQAINLALAEKIATFIPDDPLIKQVMQALYEN